MANIPPIVTLFAVFAGFTLLLFCTLSAPVIDSLGVAHIDGPTGRVANIGVFGACYEPIVVNGTTMGGCIRPKLGWTLDEHYLALAALPGRVPSIIRRMGSSLVANAIACGFAGASMLLWIFAIITASGIGTWPAFFLYVMADILSGLAFGLNLSYALVLRNHLRGYTSGVYSSHFGGVIWISMVAMIILTFGLLFACGSLSCGDHDQDATYLPYREREHVQVDDHDDSGHSNGAGNGNGQDHLSDGSEELSEQQSDAALAKEARGRGTY